MSQRQTVEARARAGVTPEHCELRLEYSSGPPIGSWNSCREKLKKTCKLATSSRLAVICWSTAGTPRREALVHFPPSHALICDSYDSHRGHAIRWHGRRRMEVPCSSGERHAYRRLARVGIVAAKDLIERQVTLRYSDDPRYNPVCSRCSMKVWACGAEGPIIARGDVFSAGLLERLAGGVVTFARSRSKESG